MNSIEQIKPAVKILRRNKVKYALLHCTNIYPTPPELVRLNCLSELKKNFKDAVIGLSDLNLKDCVFLLFFFMTIFLTRSNS